MARYHTSLSQFVQIVNDHREKEAKARHTQLVSATRLNQLEWLTQRALSDDETEAYPHAAPYTSPAPFELPSVISGFLLLQRLGLDRKGRADLLRATGGLDLQRIEQVLRSSEAEHFGRRNHTPAYWGRW